MGGAVEEVGRGVGDDRLELAELAGVDQLVGRVVPRVVAPQRAHVHHDVALLAGGDHGLRLGEGGGEGLLGEESARAVLRGVDEDLRAVLRLGHDADDVRALLLDHLLVVRVEVLGRDVVALTPLRQDVRAQVAARDQLDTLAGLVGGGVAHRQPVRPCGQRAAGGAVG